MLSELFELEMMLQTINPYHDYVDMLIESKRWKHSIFTSFITSFHVFIKIMLCSIEAWNK